MTTDNSVTTGYEAQLCEMGAALRGSMDAGEYKHVVIGLIFLKYASDAFEEPHAPLEAEADCGSHQPQRVHPRPGQRVPLGVLTALMTESTSVDDCADHHGRCVAAQRGR